MHDSLEYPKILTTLARLYINTLNIQKAYEKNEVALKIISNKYEQLHNLGIKAEIFLYQEKYPQAEAILLDIYALATKGKDFKQQYRYNNYLLQLYTSWKKWDEAIQQYYKMKQAEEQIKQLQAEEKSTQQKIENKAIQLQIQSKYASLSKAEFLIWTNFYEALPVELFAELEQTEFIKEIALKHELDKKKEAKTNKKLRKHKPRKKSGKSNKKRPAIFYLLGIFYISKAQKALKKNNSNGLYENTNLAIDFFEKSVKAYESHYNEFLSQLWSIIPYVWNCYAKSLQNNTNCFIEKDLAQLKKKRDYYLDYAKRQNLDLASITNKIDNLIGQWSGLSNNLDELLQFCLKFNCLKKIW